MIFETLTTLGAIGFSNYVAWGDYRKLLGRVGDFFRSSTDASDKSALEEAEVKKTEVGEDKHLVFECSKVSVVDFVTKKQLAGLELEVESAKKRRVAEESKPVATEASDVAGTTPQYYNIKIETNRKAENLTLAELYFSDWQDFTITITRVGELEPLSPTQNKEEYDQVLQTLKTFLPRTTLFQTKSPDQLVSAVENGAGTINFTKEQDWHFLESDKFTQGLFSVAIQKIKEGDSSVLDTYFETLEQRNRNVLLNVGKKHLELLAEKEKQEKIIKAVERRSRNIKIAVAVGFVAVIAVAAVALVFGSAIVAGVASSAFLASIGSVTVSAFRSMMGFFSKVMGFEHAAVAASAANSAVNAIIEDNVATGVSAVVSAGVVTSTIGFGKKIGEFVFGTKKKKEAKKALEKANEELAEVEYLEEHLSKDVNKQVEKVAVLKALDNIRQDAKGAWLKLEKTGHIGFLVVCDHLYNNSVPYHQKIDLEDISTGRDEIQLISLALSNNFSITELKFKYTGPLPPEKEVRDANDNIEKQLLINGYLRGQVFTAEESEKVRRLFGDDNGLKEQALEKVRANFYLVEFPLGTVADVLQKDVEGMLRQNELFLTFSRQPDIGVYGQAFELDRKRCASFMADLIKKIGPAQKKQVQSAVFEGILELHELDIASRRELLKTVFAGGSEDKIALKNRLDKQRKESKVAGEVEETEELNRLLQMGLQEDLEKAYACLKAPFGVADLANLQRDLDKNYDLRSFNFPVGISGKVKSFMTDIINRNKLYDTTFDYDKPTGQLQAFLEVYTSIQSVDERKSCLSAFMKISGAGEKLLELVRQDIYANNIQLLRDSMEEAQRTELLTVCFKKDARGTATLLSKLLAVEPKIDAKYIEGIFVKSGQGGKGWTFKECISQIKGLRDQLHGTDAEHARKIDDILSAAIGEDLKSRYPVLTQKIGPLDSINQVQKELENNHDIKISDFVGEQADKSLKDLAKFICDRNSIIELIRKNKGTLKEPDLDGFLKLYQAMYNNKSVDAKLRERGFKEIEPFAILKAIGSDKGSWEKLRAFARSDHEAFLAMLTQGFSMANTPETEAKKKAEMIGEIFKLDGLFSDSYTNDPVVSRILSAVNAFMIPKDEKDISGIEEFKRQVAVALNKDISNEAPEKQKIVASVKYIVIGDQVAGLDLGLRDTFAATTSSKIS